MNVKARAEAVCTFRHVNVVLMECLAAWVPSTPEMEAKVLFGRHLWLAAQAADRLGKRARELRAPLHHSRAPDEAYARALAALAAVQPGAARLAAFYGLALPSLERAYAAYLEDTDSLIDEPTVVIVQDALRDIERMRAEHSRLLGELPQLKGDAPDELRRLFAEARDMVAASSLPQPA